MTKRVLPLGQPANLVGNNLRRAALALGKKIPRGRRGIFILSTSIFTDIFYGGGIINEDVWVMFVL